MTTPVKRALISVANKTNLISFAQRLVGMEIEILATGGTSKALLEANIAHTPVETLTGFAQLFDGRLKTLHPKIQGGILGKRDKHQQEAITHEIDWIDLVVVNFYPFEQATKQPLTWEEMVEYIDIGGPTMVRSAAKNFAWVSVVVDPADYDSIINTLQQQRELDSDTRRYLAGKAFALTSHYDALIHNYFNQVENGMPDKLSFHVSKKHTLRYGENPHQQACVYQFPDHTSGILSARLHQGKQLSYNNMLDADAALACVNEFSDPACVIVKHANPCGVAIAHTIEKAFERANQADKQAAFGGIIALNRPCTEQLARMITGQFFELVIAPNHAAEAITLFKSKPNLRVIELPAMQDQSRFEMKFISDGILWQEKDRKAIAAVDLDCVTRAKPSVEQLSDLLFAWQVVKHVKSNGIVIAQDACTLGIGPGQVSRIDAVELAIKKANLIYENSAVLASDAFFPFRDNIDRLAEFGIKAIIQPGGSVRDAEVITACDQHEIAMLFTYQRCFKH